MRDGMGEHTEQHVEFGRPSSPQLAPVSYQKIRNFMKKVEIHTEFRNRWRSRGQPRGHKRPRADITDTRWKVGSMHSYGSKHFLGMPLFDFDR